METQRLSESGTRAASEREYFNRYAESLQIARINPMQVFAPTCQENVFMLQQIGSLRGKRILDIGCGQGDTSVFFALQGAEVWAVDVSDGMVDFTRKLAAHHAVSDRIHAAVRRVEDLDFSDDFFDVVYGDGVLHHLDIQTAVPNIVRMLKPAGCAVFLEPLKGNLFIRLYRRVANALRSTDERPLELQDLEFIRNQFQRWEHREYHLLSLALFGVRFAVLKLQGKAFTYWMDEVRQGEYHPQLLRRLQNIDEWLVRRFPWLWKSCWITIISGQK